jgi:hypothetical protein
LVLKESEINSEYFLKFCVEWSAMKTKLLLLCGAIIAACSLTSCDIYGYPGYGYTGYGGGYGRSCNNSYYSSPLLGLGSYYGGYSRPYAYSNYNRNCHPTPYRSFGNFGNIGYSRSSYSSPFLGRTNLSSCGSGFGGSPFGNRGFASSPFGGFGGGHGFGGFGGGHRY